MSLQCLRLDEGRTLIGHRATITAMLHELSQEFDISSSGTSLPTHCHFDHVGDGGALRLVQPKGLRPHGHPAVHQFSQTSPSCKSWKNPAASTRCDVAGRRAHPGGALSPGGHLHPRAIQRVTSVSMSTITISSSPAILCSPAVPRKTSCPTPISSWAIWTNRCLFSPPGALRGGPSSSPARHAGLLGRKSDHVLNAYIETRKGVEDDPRQPLPGRGPDAV